MAFILDSDLRTRANRMDEGIRKQASRVRSDTNVFLSHSQLDEPLIRGAVDLLTSYGGRPYVDSADQVVSTMSEPTEKATHFRDRIRDCKRLALMVTESSILLSNWTPWEVGLADGMFGSSQVAMLPVSQAGRGEEWGQREYLAIYPRIEMVHLVGKSTTELAVRIPANGNYWTFRQWLSLP